MYKCVGFFQHVPLLMSRRTRLLGLRSCLVLLLGCARWLLPPTRWSTSASLKSSPPAPVRGVARRGQPVFLLTWATRRWSIVGRCIGRWRFWGWRGLFYLQALLFDGLCSFNFIRELITERQIVSIHILNNVKKRFVQTRCNKFFSSLCLSIV